MMDTTSTPAEPSLTSSVTAATFSDTVQPTSTGFTMSLENMTGQQQTTSSASTTSSDPAMEEPTIIYSALSTTGADTAGSTTKVNSDSLTMQPTTTNSIMVETSTSTHPPSVNTTTSTSAGPSLTSSVTAATFSETVQPTSTGFTMSLETTTEQQQTTSGTSTTSSDPAMEEQTIKYSALSTTGADTAGSTTTVNSDSLTMQPMTTSSMMVETSTSTHPPSVETATGVTPTNLRLTTNSEMAALSLSKEYPSKTDIMTSTESTGIVSTPAVTRETLFRRESSLPYVLRYPPKDWEFTVFLDNLAEGIDNACLKRLKHFVTGEGGIRSGVLEKVETALDFFRILSRQQFLTQDNLIFLQAMLWHMRRKDLHQKCVKFARSIGTTLYFYAPSEEPENGYRHVKFHVAGKTLGDMDRKDLEILRLSVAKLLMVPTQFVFVSGLEPSSSLTVTLMIPDYYVSLLIEMIAEGSIPELTDIGIDRISYEGNLYDLYGDEDAKPEKYEGRDDVEIYERLKRAESLLNQRETEVIELGRSLDKAKGNLQRLRLEKAEDDLLELPTLQTQSALAYFESSMTKVRESGHDTEEVMKLLEANTYFISSKTKDETRHAIRELKNDIEDLRLRLAKQRFESFISKMLPEIKSDFQISLLEQVLRSDHGLPSELDHLGLMFLLLMQANKGKRSDILRNFSDELTKEEMDTMISILHYDWTTEENLLMKEDPGTFLEIVLKKECQKSEEASKVDIPSFVSRLFEHINRGDLAKRFIEEWKGREDTKIGIEIGIGITTRENTKSIHQRKSQGHQREIQEKQFEEIQNSLKRVEDMLNKLMFKGVLGRSDMAPAQYLNHLILLKPYITANIG